MQAKGVDKKAMERFKHLELEYPVGKIIAKALITDCIPVDDNLREILAKTDSLVYKGVISKTSKDWNGYGFKLEKIEKINPIEVNGKLSLWDYDYEDESISNYGGLA